jgi:hypothetical protein
MKTIPHHMIQHRFCNNQIFKCKIPSFGKKSSVLNTMVQQKNSRKIVFKNKGRREGMLVGLVKEKYIKKVNNT